MCVCVCVGGGGVKPSQIIVAAAAIIMSYIAIPGHACTKIYFNPSEQQLLTALINIPVPSFLYFTQN